MNGITNGFTCDTMNVFTLNNSVNLCIGRSQAMDPSINTWFFVAVYGTIWPLEFFQNNSTGWKTPPGMAHEAEAADHIST
jgi:hypothetical protein